MAVIKCGFHRKDGNVVVTPHVARLTPGDKIVFDEKDNVLVDPGSGCVDLVVNHALEITAELEGKGDDERFIITFDPIGGGGDPTGPGGH
jgi:hypothetical protein